MNTKWDILVYAIKRGLGYGAGLGALYGTIVTVLIGTLYGLFIGGFAGVIGGVVCGFGIGLVTGPLKPQMHPLRYRWIIMAMSAVIAAVEMMFTMLVIVSPDTSIVQSLQFFYVPILIAALTAAYSAYGLTKRWIAGQKPSNSVPVSTQKSVSLGGLS